jgi:hypothetical protein
MITSSVIATKLNRTEAISQIKKHTNKVCIPTVIDKRSIAKSTNQHRKQQFCWFTRHLAKNNFGLKATVQK